MNSKFFIVASALLLLTIAFTNPSTSFAASTANMDDPKMSQDNARIANDKVMNAQALSRGIACETGTCFKDAHSSQGFEAEPVIEPPDSASAAAKSKSGAGKIEK